MFDYKVIDKDGNITIVSGAANAWELAASQEGTSYIEHVRDFYGYHRVAVEYGEEM